MSLTITNDEFLKAIFGKEYTWCHVTDFPYDPSNLPKDKHLIAWKGDYYCRYNLQPNTNQYFTISLFYCDEQQQARRRKSLYRSTPVIVLDDVREKLSIDEVNKLPRPSWILETSQGSEQWGYILNKSCEERAQLENLLDGLVANGLAPDGRDPGMKGVTRYVRLPEGINNKQSKLINGQPFQCRMLLWEPFNTVTLEQLSTPFCVDLHAARREGRLDGAANVSDHPLINIPDIINIKEIRSNGRFDITCPWVDEHTGGDDSGSGIFTNSDGTIGFKCHHGSCQHRTGADLLRYIEEEQPGFNSQLKNWQVMRELSSVSDISFMQPLPEVTTNVTFLQPAIESSVTESNQEVTSDAIQLLCDKLRRERPSTPDARILAQTILKHVDSLPKIDQKHWHDIVCDLMDWAKTDFREILADLRKQWYGEKISSADFYNNVMFVKELNQFYDWQSRIFFTPEAFQNSYSHEDAEARKIALQNGRVQKVDRLDYAPNQPRIFKERNLFYGNTWSDASQSQGTPGDVERWLQHFDVLEWTEHRKHIEQLMSFTLRHPDQKINHILLLGSGEGCGKDFLLYPLMKAMGDNHETISGEQLLEGYHDYILSTKYLHINETELGDRKEALAVSNKLKPLAAAPPETLSVNQKNIKRINVRNILNASMTTNSLLPMRINGVSRRFYAVWSDFNPRDHYDNMMPEWLEYWEDRWNWMKNEGWANVVHYLYHQVDLSDFNPFQAPPMTDFLREMKEASKSPMQQTLDNFIQKQHGNFKCDVLSATDMCDTLKLGAFAPGDMLTEPRYFTPKKIGMILREQGVKFIRTKNVKLWIIRNSEKYRAMGSTFVEKEYRNQLKACRTQQPITVVK